MQNSSDRVTELAANPLDIPQKTLDFLKAASDIETRAAAEARSVVFLPSVFCQSALPYKNPGPNVAEWIRTNGNLTLRVIPGIEKPKSGQPTRYEHAYGVIPRLLLPWITTQVIWGSDAVHGRRVHFGSLNEFMRGLGVIKSGGDSGSIKRVTRQTTALAQSTIQIRRDGHHRVGGIGVTFASEFEICWTAGTADQPALPGLDSYIVLSNEMYDEMKHRGVPLDARALAQLRKQGSGGLPIDIYTWLAHRLMRVQNSNGDLVPWQAVAAQFGNQYGLLRNFKRDFTKRLGLVRSVYLSARVEPEPDGLRLFYSDPPIAQKPLLGG